MTDEERYLFDLNGYLVVREVLTAEELKALNDILDAMPPWEEKTETRNFHTGPVLDWGEPFRQLVGHPGIFPYLTEVLGAKFRLDHVYAIFMKKGGELHTLHGGGTPYDPGQYYHFRNGRMYNGLTVYSFMLTDVPAGGGGFCCIPGSHKSNLTCPSRFRQLAEPADCVVHVPAKAGDVIIFTEALTHGTLQWTADHERRSLLYKYAPGHLSWASRYPTASDEYEWNEEQRRIFEPPYVGRRGNVRQKSESV